MPDAMARSRSTPMRESDVRGDADRLREVRGLERREGMRVVLRVESRGGRAVVRWPDGREVVALRPSRHAEGGSCGCAARRARCVGVTHYPERGNVASVLKS